jgi:hypothetical protein
MTMTMRSGVGWAILDTSWYAGQPGVHTIGTKLAITTATVLHAILRAAEHWAPGGEDLIHGTAIVRRRGWLLAELAQLAAGFRQLVFIAAPKSV